MPNIPKDWIFDHEQQKYYRVTTDSNGQTSSVWITKEEIAQNETQQDTASSHSHSRSDSTENEMVPSASDAIRGQLSFRGTPDLGWYDRLDSRYRVREKREAHEFFRTGRVFAMLWAESASATMTRGATENTAVTIGRFGEQVFSQIRRFVIVKVHRKRHFIYACAISTYGRNGTLKNGCNPAEHTIVYLEGANPTRLEGEWERGMTKDPIMIIPSDPRETMDPTSRLRCGKIYSIEWNVKLREIGMVADHDRTKLMQYFAEEQNNGFDIDNTELSPQPQHYSHSSNEPSLQPQHYYHPSNQSGSQPQHYHYPSNQPALQPQYYHHPSSQPALQPQYYHHPSSQPALQTQHYHHPSNQSSRQPQRYYHPQSNSEY